ncbi:hypothetical protein GUJ93_ZPchr0006g41254 [Zizania palustris]|uniref:Uncharacterized protein n=1 Tax=Zizania palustris TaxID=103762 RepID=A0A8J5T2N2_ZIZPA|nr:hypothetical protein GUJ93_ZPchr0006g41254 [Zizania palustris]KAG8072684.1 hypothetical protein GUJ93_ZPchr0006g41254 [Zizania palustris]KAG8072685.1 hypothetical protein GUJ93_ZPchr0006g41254 [Zizania palustris]KAG8072686.1 hypothetical protein GUJ93_ZPchr0006g41254 [Zizania palustris]
MRQRHGARFESISETRCVYLPAMPISYSHLRRRRRRPQPPARFRWISLATTGAAGAQASTSSRVRPVLRPVRPHPPSTTPTTRFPVGRGGGKESYGFPLPMVSLSPIAALVAGDIARWALAAALADGFLTATP